MPLVPSVPLLLRLLRLLAAAWLCLWAAAAAGAPLVLADREPHVDAWPAVRVLADPTQALGVDQVLHRRAAFQPPEVPKANFGLRRGALWLHLPLQVQGAGRWVMEVDYPPLNRVDVWLLSGGRVQSAHRLGNDQPFDQRPVRSRAHALSLDLPPGVDHELLVRVHSHSSLLVPISFHRADTFVQHESARQILQGLMFGMALALLAYCIVNGISLRDALFAQYGVMLLGVGLFFASYNGIGQQYLWQVQTGLMAKMAPLGVLLALVGGSLFVGDALELARTHPRVTLALRAVALAAALAFVAAIAGLLDYRQTQTAATVLGPLPMLLPMVAAVSLARGGNRTARLMIVGWGAYLVGALGMAGLLRGLLPAEFWSLHLFQFATMAEMLVWMRVLSLRTEDARRLAERSEAERHALHSLAHTDPLTGLPNRRGLSLAMAQALQQCRPDHGVAIFMLDLDGFKPVNDRLGHDAGDTLLVQVAHRLRSLVRGADVVARLGGDEFVVMALGPSTEADARWVGRKLLDAFTQPFDVAGQRCTVGLTIGFALAPQDGDDPAQLLKLADAAMYAGKQAGRHCLRRAPVPAAV
jgi:diguanylate cyclase (GGDEF)-like protein